MFDDAAVKLTAACTENSILIDCVTESPSVSGDDRDALLVPDRVRFAVQLEEPARSVLTSADGVAAIVYSA